MDYEDQFIPLIHNYCDRWCERCAFTARCRVFAMEAEMLEDAPEIDGETFVHNLVNILEDAKRMLTEKAADLGLDSDALDGSDLAKLQEEKTARVHGDELAKLAERYAAEAGPLLDADPDWTAAAGPDESTIDEVLAVLHWYRFFIAAKIERALGGIAKREAGDPLEQPDPAQSDANGSAKIALIALERSILAWTYLLDENNDARIRPLIQLLELIKHRAEDKFPHARDFIRPGFDEIETIM